MAIFFFFFAAMIALGVAATVGVLIYLVVKRVNEEPQPYERRTN